jgi:IS5 family transposase
MKAKTQNKFQGKFLYPDLMDQLNPDHPLLFAGQADSLAAFREWLLWILQQDGTSGKAHPTHGLC